MRITNPSTEQWVGTYGKNPCEISLAKCVQQANDKKTCRYVGRCIMEFRKGCNSLQLIPKNDREIFLQLWKKNFIDKIIKRKLPDAVESHLRCCLGAYYQMTLNFEESNA